MCATNARSALLRASDGSMAWLSERGSSVGTTFGLWMDLGKSGGGTTRPGFEKLLAAICEGRVGAVVSLEASRLARNGRDWHTRCWSDSGANKSAIGDNRGMGPRLLPLAHGIPDIRRTSIFVAQPGEVELSFFRCDAAVRSLRS
ncbi:MAG: recombinase family protein [Acetobacteraceae bacterium]